MNIWLWIKKLFLFFPFLVYYLKYFNSTVCILTLLLVSQFVTIGYTQHGRSSSHQRAKLIAEVTLWSKCGKATIGIVILRVERIHKQWRNRLSVWSLAQRKVSAAKCWVLFLPPPFHLLLSFTVRTKLAASSWSFFFLEAFLFPLFWWQDKVLQ